MVAWLPALAFANVDSCELAIFVESPLSTAFVRLRERAVAVAPSGASPLWRRLLGRVSTVSSMAREASPELLVSSVQFVRQHRSSIGAIIDAHASILHPLDARFRQLGLADAITARDYSRRLLLAEMPSRVAVIKSSVTGKEFFLLYLGPLDEKGRWPDHGQALVPGYFVIDRNERSLVITPLEKFEGSLSPDDIRVASNEIPCLNAAVIQRFENTERFVASNNHLLNVKRTLSYNRQSPSRLLHAETTQFLFPLNEANRKLIADLAILGSNEPLIFVSPVASVKATVLQQSYDRFELFRNFESEEDFVASLGNGGDVVLERFSSKVASKATFYSIESARTLAHPELQDYFSRIAQLAKGEAGNFLSDAISVFQEFEGIDLGHLKALREWIRAGELLEAELQSAQRALLAYSVIETDQERFEYKTLHLQQLEIALGTTRNVRGNLIAFRKMFLGQLQAVENGLRQLAQANQTQATLNALQMLKWNSGDSAP